MIKILIIGASGFLGTTLVKFRKTKDILDKNYYFITADVYNKNIAPDLPFYNIDITNPNKTFEEIVKIAPDIIILTAAMTDVDQCEIDKDIAIKINTEGPKNVVRACKKLKSKLIFMSTDFVFDGLKEEGSYVEDDIPNPLSHYAKTKYDAELAIINSGIDSIICRTAVLYGWNKEKLNFITWIIKKLAQNEKISIITSQINSPTYVLNLAEIVLKLIEKEALGIFHTVGDCALNRYEMAVKCAEIFEYDINLITSIEQINQRAIRPKNAGLDISKLKSVLGPEFKIFNFDDGIKHMREHKPT